MSRRDKRVARRALLKSGAASLLAAALGACTNRLPGAAAARADALPADPGQILDLLPGFSYSVLQQTGDPMSDGYRVPGRPDGMACFAGADGGVILMRNHELWQSHLDSSYFLPDQPRALEAYEEEATGAVTRVVLDPDTGQVRSSNLVLAGTYWNCAGGTSPWGWLSCEETVEPAHGYVFLCAPEAEQVQPAVRIDGYGRFRHEAAAVDPHTLIAYLSEDQLDACFYRFVPDDPELPLVGSLQALRVPSAPNLDTGLLPPGVRLEVDWVDIADPVPLDDSVRLQAHAQGAARFRRTEGLWLTQDEVFLCATTGGPLGRGQVLRLGLGDGGMLEVIAEANDLEALDMPDNLCVSPQGVLYVAEDGFDGNFLRTITPEGRVAAFARNARSQTEFAGPCFSPDGSTLFVNLQEEGLTLAIRGPFDEEAWTALPGGARRARVA